MSEPNRDDIGVMIDLLTGMDKRLRALEGDTDEAKPKEKEKPSESRVLAPSKAHKRRRYKQGKYAHMLPPNFWMTKNKQQIRAARSAILTVLKIEDNWLLSREIARLLNTTSARNLTPLRHLMEDGLVENRGIRHMTEYRITEAGKACTSVNYMPTSNGRD